MTESDQEYVERRRREITAKYIFPKSVCTCGHEGDGGDSEHEGAGGHGACTATGCACLAFTWASWAEPFQWSLDDAELELKMSPSERERYCADCAERDRKGEEVERDLAAFKRKRRRIVGRGASLRHPIMTDLWLIAGPIGHGDAEDAFVFASADEAEAFRRAHDTLADHAVHVWLTS